MFVCPETDPLLEATLLLMEVADRDEHLPALRAGVARGPALGRAGDWYGRPVNLASRITGKAPEGGVLATHEVVETVAGEFEASGADDLTLKGKLSGPGGGLPRSRVGRDDRARRRHIVETRPKSTRRGPEPDRRVAGWLRDLRPGPDDGSHVPSARRFCSRPTGRRNDH